MRLVVRVYLDGLFSMEGVERVAREGGLLVCSNHASTVDPPLLPAVLPRSDTWSMAKSEYFARPGLSRWLFTHYHAFPVVRHSADRQALRRAQEILSGGVGDGTVIRLKVSQLSAPRSAEASSGVRGRRRSLATTLL